jgi:hypothetical protein
MSEAWHLPGNSNSFHLFKTMPVVTFLLANLVVLTNTRAMNRLQGRK